MISIARATAEDAHLLSNLGMICFLESHGLSAPKKDIETYINLTFNESIVVEQLQDPDNQFYLIYFDEKPVGYSKTIFNCSHQNIKQKNVTKLERLYILKDYYDLKLGIELFNFNLKKSVDYGQFGMWLFVWTQNLRAFRFYKKTGFKIIGHHDFKISETHSNPNYQMLLTYQSK